MEDIQQKIDKEVAYRFGLSVDDVRILRKFKDEGNKLHCQLDIRAAINIAKEYYNN
jgi:hypothetical protein